jgi:hypothetical protein
MRSEAPCRCLWSSGFCCTPNKLIREKAASRIWCGAAPLITGTGTTSFGLALPMVVLLEAPYPALGQLALVAVVLLEPRDPVLR